MATWPGTLPDYVMQSGFSETLPNNVIRTKMEVGPPKMRRRGTAAPRPMKWKLYMTTAQVATLRFWPVRGTGPVFWRGPGAPANFSWAPGPAFDLKPIARQPLYSPAP